MTRVRPVGLKRAFRDGRGPVFNVVVIIKGLALLLVSEQHSKVKQQVSDTAITLFFQGRPPHIFC